MVQSIFKNPIAVAAICVVTALFLVRMDSATRNRAHKPRVYLKCALLAVLMCAIVMVFRPYHQDSIVQATVPDDEIFTGEF